MSSCVFCPTAVKKGRYSLDRRAEAILESRNYWKSENEPKVKIKKEVDSCDHNETPPLFTSSGSPRSPSRILSPNATNVSDSLSTDDIFLMLGEVYDEEIAKASGDPISTIDTLLSASDNAQLNNLVDTINIRSLSPNIQPTSQSNAMYNNASPLGQLTVNTGSTESRGQMSYQEAINTTPNLLPESDIKREFPPQQCYSGFGLPPPDQNLAAPNYGSNGLPQGCRQYATTADGVDLFGYALSSTSNFLENPVYQSRLDQLPLYQSPPVQPE